MAPHFFFLNVDLDIESRFDLSSLESELGHKVSVLSGGPVKKGCSLLRIETAVHYKNADDTILAFCSMLEKLSPRAKRAWLSAHKKEFDVGHDVALSQFASRFSLQTKTLKRMAGLGATLGITFYNQSFVSPAKRRRGNQSR